MLDCAVDISRCTISHTKLFASGQSACSSGFVHSSIEAVLSPSLLSPQPHLFDRHSAFIISRTCCSSLVVATVLLLLLRPPCLVDSIACCLLILVGRCRLLTSIRPTVVASRLALISLLLLPVCHPVQVQTCHPQSRSRRTDTARTTRPSAPAIETASAAGTETATETTATSSRLTMPLLHPPPVIVRSHRRRLAVRRTVAAAVEAVTDRALASCTLATFRPVRASRK